MKQHLQNAVSGKQNALYQAIRKYGNSQFSFQVICSTWTKENANVLESLFIHINGSYISEHGYNMTRGGDGFDSETTRNNALRRISNGTHHFQGEAGKQLQRRRILEGTHPLSGQAGKDLQQRRISDCSHLFSKTEYPDIARYRELEKVSKGTHPFVGTDAKLAASERANSRVKNGTHNLMGEAGKNAIAELKKLGKHCSQIEHICPVCGRTGKGNYFKGTHFEKCVPLND